MGLTTATDNASILQQLTKEDLVAGRIFRIVWDPLTGAIGLTPKTCDMLAEATRKMHANRNYPNDYIRIISKDGTIRYQFSSLGPESVIKGRFESLDNLPCVGYPFPPIVEIGKSKKKPRRTFLSLGKVLSIAEVLDEPMIHRLMTRPHRRQALIKLQRLAWR